MDDFRDSTLRQSSDIWCNKLIRLLTPCIIDGFKSILKEACDTAQRERTPDQYLKHFQNLVSSVPNWSSTKVDQVYAHVQQMTKCTYFDDLLTCVHIVTLKSHMAIKPGSRLKKIEIQIPRIREFVHKTYINVARECFRFSYLFATNIPPIEKQKRDHLLQMLVETCIQNTISDNIPTEKIMRAYLDDTSEEQEEEIVIEKVESVVPIEEGRQESAQEKYTKELKENPNMYDAKPELSGGAVLEDNKNGVNNDTSSNTADMIDQGVDKRLVIENVSDAPVISKLSFDDSDHVLDMHSNTRSVVSAPKDVDTLERIGMERHLQRKMEEEQEEEDDISFSKPIQFDKSEELSLDDLFGNSSLERETPASTEPNPVVDKWNDPNAEFSLDDLL